MPLPPPVTLHSSPTVLTLLKVGIVFIIAVIPVLPKEVYISYLWGPHGFYVQVLCVTLVAIICCVDIIVGLLIAGVFISLCMHRKKALYLTKEDV